MQKSSSFSVLSFKIRKTMKLSITVAAFLIKIFQIVLQISVIARKISSSNPREAALA